MNISSIPDNFPVLIALSGQLTFKVATVQNELVVLKIIIILATCVNFAK